jgi:hypothetical protein
VVRVTISTIRPPRDHRRGAHRRDRLPDAPRDLGVVAFVHSAVGVVPDLEPGQRERGRGRLHLRGADLAEILAPRARRFASPALLATSGADQVDHHVVARVPDDQAAGAHGFVIRVGQHGKEPTHSGRER